MIKKLKEYIKVALGTGFLYIMLSNVLNSFFGFISKSILARIISKTDYGVYSYANNILSYFLLFTGLGMVSGTLQICCEHNKNETKMYSIYRYGFSRGILINIFLGVCIIFYSRFVEMPIQDAQYYLLLMALLPLINIILEFTGIYFRSNYRNKEYAITYTINAALICFISTLGALKLGVSGIILASYMGPVLSVLFIYFFTTEKRKKWNVSSLEKQLKREIWKVSLVSMGVNAISQLMYLIDISMIGEYIKDEKVIASYQIATMIPTALLTFPLAVMTYIYPYFVSHINDLEWTRKKYKIIFWGMGLVNFCISLILIVAAPQIIGIVFGNQYQDAVPVFRILSFSYFWQGTFRIIAGNLLVTQKKLKFNLIASILTAVVNIIADYLLISRFQSIGVALATLIVMIFSGILSTIYYMYVINKGK
ncbi:MAG: oligosaccharide flippase family protein [Lachnospiraceae bacterium]|nr:oligosaccharide flippase family protein [Lachnospiraceae bacterium]